MIDLDFINPFVSGTVDVLRVQGKLTVEAGTPFIKGKEPMPALAIAAQLGLASAQVKGAVSLCFEEQVFLKVLSNMFDETITQIDDENQDGASELLNMVYGHAKTALNPKGYKLVQTIPTVVRGKELQTSHGRLPTLVIPLKSEFGSIFIEVTVQKIA